MYESFERLNPEKRGAILCAAIANGSLFHYFGDKKVQFENAFFRRSVSDTQHQPLLEGLDDGLIRDDLPPVEVNRMLWWILDGYSNELSEQVTGQPYETMNMEYEISRFDRFLALLRHIFYR